MLASEPDEVFHTSHAPAQVAACFAHRNHARVIERADGARVVAFRNGCGGVVKVFSIYPDGQGSRIECRHNSFDVLARSGSALSGSSRRSPATWASRRKERR